MKRLDLAALAKSLGVTIKHDESTAALVARFRLLGQIEHGDLPSVDVPILQREVCYFSGPAAHHEIKVVTKRVNYSGPTASIRIMKGVRWRVGSISTQKVTTDVMTQRVPAASTSLASASSSMVQRRT